MSIDTSATWVRWVPEWAGNARSAAPFYLEIRRFRRRSKLKDFLAQAQALLSQPSVTAAQMTEALAPLLKGPFGGCEIDGETIADGDLPALFTLAADEHLTHDALVVEMVRAIRRVSTLGEIAAGEFERLRGGSSSTQPAGTPDPTPAPAAGAGT